MELEGVDPIDFVDSKIHEHDEETMKSLVVSAVTRTSIRGLPRVVTSKCPGVRVVWGISIFFMLVAVVIHFVVLVNFYLEGRTRTDLSTLPSDKVHFPALTVCSANPLPKNAFRILSRDEDFSYTPAMYRTRVKNMILKTNVTKDQHHPLETLLLNNIGYYENVPERLRGSLGYENDSLVMRQLCYVFYKKDHSNVIKKEKCHFKHVSIMGHFNCFEIQSLRDEHVIELRLMAYLDEHAGLYCSHCIPEFIESYRSGLLVLPHERDIRMLDMEKAFLFPSGSRNKITITKRLRKKFCNTVVPETLNYTFLGKFHSEPYTLENCRIINAQQQMIEMCKCGISYFLPNNEDTHHCLYQDLKQNSLNLSLISCIIKEGLHMSVSGPFKRIYATNSSEICPARCIFKSYGLSHVSEPLGDHISKLSLYEYLAHEKRIIPPDPDVDRIIELRRSEDYEKNKLARLLMQNHSNPVDRIVSVSIYLGTPGNVRQLEEVLVLDIYRLVSQIGGALSMWAGVTIVCILELFEFMFYAIDLFVRKTRKKTSQNL